MISRVFVDCDQTLVNTSVHPIFSSHLFAPKPKFTYRWHVVTTEARPSAKVFLEELRRSYDVSILTLGHSHFQARVLKQLGLLSLVDSIYGPDNCDQVPKTDNFVLIDDMEPFSVGIAYKMRWLGHQKSNDVNNWPLLLHRHIIQCHPFGGGLNEGQPLTRLLDAVHERMRLQGSTTGQSQNQNQNQDLA